MTIAVNTRVRTLTDLDSADWDPEQPAIPAGALGTVQTIHHDPVTGAVWGYGVLLDDDIHRLGASMNPGEIEPA